MKDEQFTTEAFDALTRIGLSITLIIIIGLALGRLFFQVVPQSNHDVVVLIIGGLLAKLTDVFGYSFNTTASAARKDKLLASSFPPPAPGAVPVVPPDAGKDNTP